MAAQAFPYAPAETPTTSTSESAAAVWALLDVLHDLPSSPEVQTDLRRAREAIRAELHGLQVDPDSLREHARCLLARMGQLPGGSLPPRVDECRAVVRRCPDEHAEVTLMTSFVRQPRRYRAGHPESSRTRGWSAS